MTSFSTESPAIRRFGLIASLVFGGFAGFALWRQHPYLAAFFAVLGGMGLGCLILPNIFRPIYIAWHRLGLGIGLAISSLALILAYYLAVTPMAWLKRVVSGRPLSLKPDPKAESYWVPRKEPSQDKDHFYRRF